MSEEMMIREVEGWHLCSRDGADWRIRDLELAERAGLARPRDIRPTIATVVSDLAESRIAGTDRIAISADKVLVPTHNGGHRETTEYLLNREAALLVVMRLRTERALALQVEIVRVFMRVLDGDAAAQELRTLREMLQEEAAANGAELALLKNQFVRLASEHHDMKNQILLGSGMISGQQRAQIAGAKRRAARAYVAAGMAPNIRSANRMLQNGVAVTGWGGAGKRDALLPVDLFTRVLAFHEGEETKALKVAGRRAQLDLPQ